MIGRRSCKPNPKCQAQGVGHIVNAQLVLTGRSAEEADDIRAPRNGPGVGSEDVPLLLIRRSQDSPQVSASRSHDSVLLFSIESR